MKSINWEVRIKNKSFWLAMIPVLLLMAQMVGEWFGYNVPAEYIGEEATDFIKLVFVALGLLGVVEDPTTEGISDSLRALGYKEPKKKEEK